MVTIASHACTIQWPQSWVATAPDSDSPLLINYYFYNLLNPGDFLKVCSVAAVVIREDDN
jgi:hypothetical protein